jgi:hypothetical protein
MAMAALCSHRDFLTVLDFAVGVAGRGVPLSVVALGVEEGGTIRGDEHRRLEELVGRLTRRTDRVAVAPHGAFEVLLVDCNRQGALVFADRLLEGLRPWEETAGVRLRCGIACYGEGLREAGTLLAAAEGARAQAGPGGDLIALHGE